MSLFKFDNHTLFKKIGQNWGEVISISDETFGNVSFTVGKVLVATKHMDLINQEILLINNDRRYSVRVSEEQFVINTFFKSQCKCIGCSSEEVLNVKHAQSKYGTDEALLEKGTKRGGTESDMETEGKETQLMQEGGSKENVIATGSSSLGNVMLRGGSGKDAKAKQVAVFTENGDDPQISWVAESSYSKMEEARSPHHLAESKEATAVEEAQKIPIKAAIKGLKGKKKRKTIEDILGFSTIKAPRNKGRNHKQKCVVLRAAVTAAASDSISTEEILNRNKLILSEAQAVWECNKLLGIGYAGEENEVISRIAKMVEQDAVKGSQPLNLL